MQYLFAPQLGLAEYFISGHRRCGKSEGAVAFELTPRVNNLLKMREIPIIGRDVRFDYPRIAYMASTKEQARNIIWQYFHKYLTVFPHVHMDNHRMTVTLERPQFGDYIEIVLKAARNYEEVRGERFCCVYLDEYQHHPPKAWSDVFVNCLSDHKGMAWKFGTPQGRDNIFYKEIRAVLEENPLEKDVWIFPVSKTGIMEDEVLRKVRASIPEETYQREWEMNFLVGHGRTYYGELTAAAIDDKRRKCDYDESVPLILAVDIGVGLSFSSLLIQTPHQQQISLLDGYMGYEALENLHEDIVDDWWSSSHQLPSPPEMPS